MHAQTSKTDIYRHDFQRYFQNKNYFTKDEIKQKFQNKVKN